MTAFHSLSRVLIALTGLVGTAAAQQSDVPKQFTVRELPQNFIRREAMIPMRDGIKLRTVLYLPKGARGAPMMLERTPYNVDIFAPRVEAGPLFRAGYILVFQDTRGKYGSEGDYVVTRPVRGPLNPTTTDHSTDTWDTIDWLVKHVPESNGRVGMIGSSYDGFTVVMGLLDPHPALRAAVPQGPVLDGWMGDDWFHYGAFRNLMLGYMHEQTAQRGAGEITPSDTYDQYEEFRRAGSTGDYIRAHGLDQLPWVARTLEHPAYDENWQGLAVGPILAARPSNVPTLWTQGLWDQEDMYGANHAWRGLKAAGHESNNWLVLGPWNHVQVAAGGTSLGPMQWQTNTSVEYQRDILLPFLNQYLRDGPPAKLSRVTVYNSGEKRWEHFATWPTACDKGCLTALTPLYMGAGSSLTFDAPTGDAAGDTYTSDPANPVPFLPRPVIDPFRGLSGGALNFYQTWATWLVHDQRFVDGRPDVLTYETPVLTQPVRVQGVPVADIRASTTGTDGDFVVKLIDVYPALDAVDPLVSGYQMPIALDIFRGRYRDSFSHPTAIPANQPARIRFELPNVNHVFQPGHRIMVQIQSSLFPLYDRNPQTFVPNIFNATRADYRKADITILRSKDQPSAVLLPVIEEGRASNRPT